MTKLFASNLNIIVKRWPIVAAAVKSQTINELDAHLVNGRNQTISVNGIQLSSRHDRIAEAQLFISTLPADATHVTVYGVGMGDVPSLLIDNPQYLSIDVCILNLSVFALLISYTDQSEWLKHPNINLTALPSAKLNFPNIAITPDLTLVSDENAITRDLLVYELNRNFANQKHNLDKISLTRLNANIPNLLNDPDASLLLNTHSNINCIVIASGPTLEDHYPYLFELTQKPKYSRPLVIAVDTSFKALFQHKVIPDIIISIDPNIRPDHFPMEHTENVILVYFPKINPLILEQWKGPKYSAYSTSSLYDELANRYPKLRLFTNGSVVHPAIDLAIYLGAYQVSLFGCDFCYTRNKTHAFWLDGALGPQIKNAKHWLINGYGDRVPTDLNFRGYLRSLEQFIKSKPNVKFYQSSLDGARIHGAQYKDFSQ
nr:6-hydroxymethylpterin diphosphokinase MptE-like protein [uncultured Shewanella sp.]